MIYVQNHSRTCSRPKRQAPVEAPTFIGVQKTRRAFVHHGYEAQRGGTAGNR